ncbi:MAG: hypothetical protein RLZZ502_902 [Pseudomonadota bacterium]|jgi:4-hydroxy-3-methylbut-2-enyl diphosphate reductase
MSILLANPRGFCAGVERAISMVNLALQKYGAPVYVKHEIVHNVHVVADLKAKGAVFIEELLEIPKGSVVIFSAHGVSQAVQAEARALGLEIFDATCPLVTKVHVEVRRLHAQGYHIIMIGHAGHPEVEGTMGQVQGGVHLVESLADVHALNFNLNEKLSYVSQTTLSVDDTKLIIEALKAKFPHIVPPRKDDICYATQNRQDAVRALTAQSQVIVIVGSKTSSNANRLRELAELNQIPAYLVDDEKELDPAWLKGKGNIGISAGASTPEHLVQAVAAKAQALTHNSAPENLQGINENMVFRVPSKLLD